MCVGHICTFKGASAVSLLDNELFVLKKPSSKQLDVYDATDYSPRGCVTIPAGSSFVDMAACCFNHCLYLPDVLNDRIVKLQLPGMLSEWKVDDIGSDPTVSVTSSHYLPVVCDDTFGQKGKLKLFSTDGRLQTTVFLQQDIVNVNSAVELSPDQYVVTHGRESDNLHRVCVVNSGGKIINVHGGFKGSHPKLLDTPMGVVIDKDGFVCVVDAKNRRLTVLSSKQDYIHCVNDGFPTKVYPCTKERGKYDWPLPTEQITFSSLFCTRIKIDKLLQHVYLNCEVHTFNGSIENYDVRIYKI